MQLIVGMSLDGMYIKVGLGWVNLTLVAPIFFFFNKVNILLKLSSRMSMDSKIIIFR